MLTTTSLFTARTLGYHTFRVPAVVATPRGEVLAFCAARRGVGDDWDASDLVMRRSRDGGRTWGGLEVVAQGDGRNPHDNATPVATRSGTVHLLYAVGSARVYHARDDGQGFSSPTEITDVLEGFRAEYPWNIAVPGPGHGLELGSGRLVVPVWLSSGGRVHRPSVVATIHSDNGGETWRRGAIVVRDGDFVDGEIVRNPSETVALQLEDGRVLLSIRNESGRGRRLHAHGDAGLERWELEFHPELPEPVCMASLVRVPGAAGRVVYVSPDPRGGRTHGWYGRTAPESPEEDRHARPLTRERLTLRLSEDDGRTWPVSRVLEPGLAGYADLAALPDGTLLCLFERGGVEGNMFDPQDVALARLDLGWLLEEPALAAGGVG